jgi:hypothetical protein
VHAKSPDCNRDTSHTAYCMPTVGGSAEQQTQEHTACIAGCRWLRPRLECHPVENVSHPIPMVDIMRQACLDRQQPRFPCTQRGRKSPDVGKPTDRVKISQSPLGQSLQILSLCLLCFFGRIMRCGICNSQNATRYSAICVTSDVNA